MNENDRPGPAHAAPGEAPGATGAIGRRKDEHLDIVLGRDVAGRAVATGFDEIRFEHVALPELALDDVDLSTTFLGRTVRAPLLISSMTGGPSRAATINRAIAEAAEATGIAFAVGSQRIALEAGAGGGAGGLTRALRDLAPSVPLLANFGAAQLREWNGPEMARRAVDMIGADGLIIHLNPLQEAVQAGGDTDWRGLLGRIEAVARQLHVPVVAKEVGAGISGAIARRLVDAGVAVIDVAGAGGTSWAQVEAERAAGDGDRQVAAAFRDWGIPTVHAIRDARAACPGTPIVASGGIRDGIDAAKAIRLGADMAAQAAGVLAAAVAGGEALAAHIGVVTRQLRIAMFATGSADLAALKRARLIQMPAALL